MKTVSYQGIEGSFSHLTAKRLFGESARYVGFPSFDEAYRYVEEAKADAALLPIENALAGMIFETVDLLINGSLLVGAETKTLIELSLFGIEKTSLKEIRKVFSHPKALAQCRRFFETHPWIEAVSHYDTAGAAADIAKIQDPSCCAIASRIAGSIYGLKTIQDALQDHKNNFTRFFVLSKDPISKGKKGALCFKTAHSPGSLAKILTLFAKEGLNLNSLVSRPWIGKPFEYHFYAELEDEKVLHLETLNLQTVKILGTYEAV